MLKIQRTQALISAYHTLSPQEKLAFKEVVVHLAYGESLSNEYREHDYTKISNTKACYIRPNILLVYTSDLLDLELKLYAIEKI